jgi:hypothetical protein
VGGPVHEGGHTVLGACRGTTDHYGGDVWRAYGTINIGPRATEADRCWMRIRSTWNGRASRPKWRSCDAALHRRFSHPARVNVTCVTPLGEEVASIS